MRKNYSAAVMSHVSTLDYGSFLTYISGEVSERDSDSENTLKYRVLMSTITAAESFFSSCYLSLCAVTIAVRLLLRCG